MHTRRPQFPSFLRYVYMYLLYTERLDYRDIMWHSVNHKPINRVCLEFMMSIHCATADPSYRKKIRTIFRYNGVSVCKLMVLIKNGYHVSVSSVCNSLLYSNNMFFFIFFSWLNEGPDINRKQRLIQRFSNYNRKREVYSVIFTFIGCRSPPPLPTKSFMYSFTKPSLRILLPPFYPHFL